MLMLSLFSDDFRCIFGSFVLDTFCILGSAAALTSSLMIPKSGMGLEAVLDRAKVVVDSIVPILVANSFSSNIAVVTLLVL